MMQRGRGGHYPAHAPIPTCLAARVKVFGWLGPVMLCYASGIALGNYLGLVLAYLLRGVLPG